MAIPDELNRGHWILDGHDVVGVDLLTWAKWFETADRTVAKTTLPDGTLISTVFLGIDHSFGVGKVPIIFETMVFASGENRNDNDCERYATWEQAEAGHVVMVEKWR